MPSYAFNRSGSPPVDHRSRLGGPCNISIILLTLWECSPERLPCLVEYPRLLNYSLGLILGLPAIFIIYIYETIPPLVTTWYTIWAKVIVIVATYRRVITLLPSSLALFADRQRHLLVPPFGLSITLWSLGLDGYLSWNCCNACIAVSSNISNGSQEFSSGPYL